VWWRWSAVGLRKGDANKLAPRWHGPCLVRKVIAANQYVIQYTERGATKDVSVEELKRYHPPFKGDALPGDCQAVRGSSRFFGYCCPNPARKNINIGF
jgi:hypothetical protein